MKKIALFMMLMLLLVACQNNPAPNNVPLPESKSQYVADSESEPSPSSPAPSKSDDGSHPYDRYISPLAYQLGATSWSAVEDIDPDALVVFYISLSAIGERTPITSGPTDDVYGNFLMPAEDVEQCVQRYFDFDIPKEYIEKSQYYDAEKKAYWTGGIGSTASLQIAEVVEQNGVTAITYTSVIDSSASNKPTWSSTVTLKITDDGFQYICFEETRP